VESISAFVCTLRNDYDGFVNTYATDQSAVDARLDALETPAITCVSAGVTSADSLQTILNKYCTKFGDIDTALNPSSANWNSCYVVSAPTTIVGGFNTLISQICILKALVESSTSALPTFNNIGSCLPAPLTAADTLVDTVNKIKVRLCQTGAIDTTTLSWGCVTQPSGAQNLQDTLQNILTRITAISQILPTVFDSGDFTLTNVDNTNLCLGKKVELAAAFTSDRFVAATTSDTAPGVLEDKLIPGTNVSLDYITSPGYVIINNTGGSGAGDHKVASDSGDTSPDYLSLKILAGTPNNGVQVSPSLDGTSHVVKLDVSVDPATLFQSILDELADNPSLFASLCSLIAQCPSPCEAPTNVTVTYQSGTTSTTTTTTTT
jgi:hypothetical protein